MEKFSEIGGKFAAAIGALAITVSMMSAYFSPVMVSPVSVLLA